MIRARAVRVPAGEGGFTLIELMVTLAVLAVLTMIALPNVQNSVHRQQLRSLTGSLQGALAYARNEAVLRQYSVSICASGGSQTSCSSSSDYSQGWLIYTTPAAANQPYVAGGRMSLLRIGQGDTHVAAIASVSAPISFGPQGQVVGGVSAGFETCARSGTSGNGQSTTAVPGRLLTVSAQGSVAVQSLGVLAACAAPAAGT